jgi:hypothetical protein
MPQDRTRIERGLGDIAIRGVNRPDPNDPRVKNLGKVAVDRARQEPSREDRER